MYKILRSELTKILEEVGITKDKNHKITGEFQLRNEYEGCLVIELKNNLICDTIYVFTDCLVSLFDELILFPRFTYLGAEKKAENTSLPISPYESDAIVWSSSDLELINDILFFHATDGWQIGWDLFVSEPKGKFLILLSHHNEIVIQSISNKTLQEMSKYLMENDITRYNYI